MVREASDMKREAQYRNCGLLAFALCLGLAADQAHAFNIVVPAEHSKLKSGQSLTAQVDVGSDSGIIAVRYYWYPEQAETLVQQDEPELAGGRSQNKIAVDKYLERDSVFGSVVAVPTLTSTADATPPFGGSLKVPKEAIGPMRLLVAADISRGRLGTKSVFDEIIVQVEPDAQLINIDFETDYALCDRPYEAIIAAAKKHGCDAIFMASHGRTGIPAWWYGSQTREVLTHSDIPTLVYR